MILYTAILLFQEKQKQQSQQAPWEGRKGYSPPRTSEGFMQNPQASNSNFSVGADVNQVPQGQGIPNSNQSIMSGPDGFDDILSQLNSGNMGQTGLISDVEEDVIETRQVQTKPMRKNIRKQGRNKKTDGDVIDLTPTHLQPTGTLQSGTQHTGSGQGGFLRQSSRIDGR